MNKSLFISHCTSEKDLAVSFQNLIKTYFGENLNVFVSSDENRSLPLGSDSVASIKSTLLESKIILVLCSPVSVNKNWVNFEAGAGWLNDNTTVIPICISEMNIEKLPSNLSIFQAMVSVNKPNMMNLIKQISNSFQVKAIISDKENSEVIELFLKEHHELVKEKQYLIWDSLLVSNLLSSHQNKLRKTILSITNHDIETQNQFIYDRIFISELISQLEFILTNNEDIDKHIKLDYTLINQLELVCLEFEKEVRYILTIVGLNIPTRLRSSLKNLLYEFNNSKPSISMLKQEDINITERNLSFSMTLLSYINASDNYISSLDIIKY